MNWQKYTLDGWLEQFGAWCDTVMRDEPDDLSENALYRLMVSSGYLHRPYHCKIICEITSQEALAVQSLLTHTIKQANAQMRNDISLLIAHKVSGFSLRKIADNLGLSTIDVRMRIQGARGYIKGRFWQIFA